MKTTIIMHVEENYFTISGPPLQKSANQQGGQTKIIISSPLVPNHQSFSSPWTAFVPPSPFFPPPRISSRFSSGPTVSSASTFTPSSSLASASIFSPSSSCRDSVLCARDAADGFSMVSQSSVGAVGEAGSAEDGLTFSGGAREVEGSGSEGMSEGPGGNILLIWFQHFTS